MPLGTRVKIKVLDKEGHYKKTILRCLRPFVGKYSILYEGSRYKVQGDPWKGEELFIFLRG
jgi:hypothetical protein